jgi:hypothetical protein
MKARTPLFTTLAVALAASPAAAGDDDFKKIADQLVQFATAVVDAKAQGGDVAEAGHLRAEPSACTALVADAKAAGATAKTRLYAYGWPESIKSYSYDGHKGASIAFSDAPAVCDGYATWRPLAKAAGVVAKAALQLENSAHISAKDVDKSFAAGNAKVGRECAAAIDAGIKAGAPADVKVKIRDQKLTLDEARGQICQALIDWSGAVGAEGQKMKDEKRAKVRAIYAKAGIKGKRLELFTDYGEPDSGGWYAAGCTRSVTTVKGLKAAKKLFHWFEGANGYVVRKYTFKGDTYSVSEKSFVTEAAAYKGCK